MAGASAEPEEVRKMCEPVLEPTAQEARIGTLVQAVQLPAAPACETIP